MDNDIEAEILNSKKLGWQSTTSFQCCKVFSFYEYGQMIDFLTEIIQIDQGTQQVRLEAEQEDRATIVVWIFFDKNRWSKAKTLMREVEDLHKFHLEN